MHFRVSRGILAARSPVFREVLSLPQPKEGDEDEKVDGCDVVHLFGDEPQDVTYFLRAIYDSRYVLFHLSELCIWTQLVPVKFLRTAPDVNQHSNHCRSPTPQHEV